MPKDTDHNHDFQPDIDDMIDDISACQNLQQSVSEATGALRARIKEVIETRGYHKAAFADLRKIAAMSDTKLADYWRTFKPMLDVYTVVIEDRIMDMVDKANVGADEMDSDLGGGD